jgi:hypothetical protein
MDTREHEKYFSLVEDRVRRRQDRVALVIVVVVSLMLLSGMALLMIRA